MSSPMTASLPDLIETNKTGETNPVSNEAFLQAVFGSDLELARPVVVSFTGDPSEPGKSWSGSSWQSNTSGSTIMSHLANNYFSLATFNPDDSGQYRRQKARFHALHAIMLDDIGTKVAIDRLTLPPTWLLETSEGNHQAGYLLRDPLIDSSTADRVMNAIIDAGLCDPGANGPTARLARLPVAVNGKHSPPFQCQMSQWSPALRYSVEELIDGLQLEMTEPARGKRQSARTSQERPSDEDPARIPRPEENTVLTALRAHGLYKTPLGNGKHDITCPWVKEHTDEVDGGTAYFDPDETRPIGGFKCLHGHCAERHARDLLRILGIESESARIKPTIDVVSGEIHLAVDKAERALAQSGQCYQRGGQIVTVVTNPTTHETQIHELSLPALVRMLSSAMYWQRFDHRAKDWTRIDPPFRHAAVLHDAASYPHMPVLNGLARQPYLRSDGTLMTTSGYDASTGMYGVFDAHDYTIPDNPTREDAQAALTLLKSLLAEFRFAGDADLAATLAAMLTAVVRPSLNHAPMIHTRAHVAGSGKSYLCELITAFATPQRGTPTTFPGDDEECRKLVLAELLRSPAVIEFDNLTGDLLAHKSLCTALTSEYISGRILGSSKTATAITRALFLSSGNNVGPVQDMTRRCITINLDPGIEVPATRNFMRPDLVREVLNERGKYVSAALTIVRAWIVAGKPKKACKPLASYEDWSEFCRQPLLWLDVADPAASVFESIAEDPDRETLGRLLTAWESTFGKVPTMVRDAVDRASSYHTPHKELREVLHDIADERGEINRRRLGWWIKRRAGQIVNGLRFVSATENRAAAVWRVELVS